MSPIASQGNKKEEAATMLWSLFLTILSIVGVAYLIELQTYVYVTGSLPCPHVLVHVFVNITD